MLLTGKNPFPGKNKEDTKRKIINCSGFQLVKKSTHLDSVSKKAKNFIEICLTQDVNQRHSAE